MEKDVWFFILCVEWEGISYGLVVNKKDII